MAGPVPSRPGRIVSFGMGTDGFSRQACGVLRPKNAVEHALTDVAHGRGIAVGVADLRVGRQERVGALVAPDLVLERMAHAQQRSEIAAGLARQLRDQFLDVDLLPVDGLIAKKRLVLLVDIASDFKRHCNLRLFDSLVACCRPWPIAY